MKILLTGAAGLVGSEITELLLEEKYFAVEKIVGIDNFTLGTEKHIAEFRKNKKYEFLNLDCSKPNWHSQLSTKQFDLLIHFAANSDISLGHKNPDMDCRLTFETTFQALMAARELKIPNFIFSSSSAVYGENPVFPTPENCSEMHPVSVYGSGKLASENFISGFVNNYGLNAWVFRFGNVVGKKLTHGVIYDFVKKLRKNPEKLEVLGNGKQNKTYIDVRDCVEGICHAFTKSKPGKTHSERFQVFNLSSEGATSVQMIAEECANVVTAGKAKIQYGESSIGWVGDVPKTSLEVSKMKKIGFQTKLSSTDAVKKSIHEFVEWTK